VGTPVRFSIRRVKVLDERRDESENSLGLSTHEQGLVGYPMKRGKNAPPKADRRVYPIFGGVFKI